VLDFRREVIGSYYIGDVEIVDIQPSDSVGETDLMLDFGGYFQPFPYAEKIWRRWASGVPVERDEWRTLPAEWHDSWLHVVQTAWFEAGRMPTVYEPKDSYMIDGNGMVNTDSFYCALGEAINGPGGYFGSNLDALDDCLWHAVDSHGPFELVWRNFHVAENNLGESEIAQIIAVFRDHDVRLTLQRS